MSRGIVTVNVSMSPKQKEFFLARERFIAYGGARGGGKSWAVRVKAVLMAANYPGIRILLVRRNYPELRENHILPMKTMTKDFAIWREMEKSFIFPNGSRISFGHCSGEHDVDQYQGQEYDCIFIDEATQFTEYQFQVLIPCVRGANDFPKRMYLTCNPGGVGHAWVKRLFVDRDYQGGERAEDYRFIQSKYSDNYALVQSNPRYGEYLDNLPPGLREAWRDGSWDVFIGQYFTEWNREVHVCEAFETPAWWRYYVTMDYGLDMLAAYLIGVDDKGRAYVLREVYEGKDKGEGALGLNVHDAAERVKELGAGYQVTSWLAPPDLWSRQSHTGKSTRDLFAESGVYLYKANNDRIPGWLAVKEFLRIREDGPKLRIFPKCVNLIRTLPMLQYDDKKFSDTAREPHELTHAPDALRYFCASWLMKGEAPALGDDGDGDIGEAVLDYGEVLTGGEAGAGYLLY